MDALQSQETPLRQMTILESFKYSKRKSFKMDRPSDVTSVCYVIDSDSDVETPPLFKFKRANVATNMENDSTLIPNSTKSAPSPPKMPRQMIGVYKPNTSLNMSTKKNLSPVTPKFHTIGSPSAINSPTLSLCTGSPHSRGSNSSTKTIKYEYSSQEAIFDEDTVPFPPNGNFCLPKVMGSEEVLNMNFNEDTLFHDDGSRPSRIEANAKKKAASKRLDFNSLEDNTNATSTKVKKNKNNNSQHIKNRHITEGTTGNMDNIPKKGRKRKNHTVTSNDQNINTDNKNFLSNEKNSRTVNDNTIKENSPPNQNLSTASDIAVTKDAHSTTHNLGENSIAMTPASGSGKIHIISTETLRKGTFENTSKREHLTGIVDKLRTNQEQSFSLMQLENIGIVPQNSHHNNISTPVVKTADSLSPTGWISKAVGMANVKEQNIIQERSTSNKAKTLNSQSKPINVPNTSLVLSKINGTLQVQSTVDGLGKAVQDGIEKSQCKADTKVIQDKGDASSKVIEGKAYTSSKVIQDQGDKSSKVVQDGVEKDTLKKRDDDHLNTSKKIFTTPEKQKLTPSSPTKNPSPRRKLFGSPRRGSPIKSREIKTLKSKEGKELQVRQMDELVKLFQMVAVNCHLRTLLNKNEYDILRKFTTMDDKNRYFMMKLFVWKRMWYNIFQFCQKAKIDAEEKDIIDIYEYLREEGLVDIDYTTQSSMLELLNTLSHVTVKQIMEERRIKPIRSKAENIKTILTVAGRQATLTSKSFKDLIMESIEKKMGFAIKIKEDVFDSLYNAYFLATFTNPAFYKVEDYFNNIVHLRAVFPETPVEDYPVFYSREKFLNYGLALKMRTNLDEQFMDKNRESKFMGLYSIGKEAYGLLFSLEADDTNVYSEAPHLKRFTAEHVYTGILSFCCEKLYTKQNGYPSDVKQWLEWLIKRFPNSRRLGKWYEILIRLHMRHLDYISYESGAKVLIEALDAKKLILDEIAKHDLAELGHQLKSSRKYKLDQMYHDRIAQLVPRLIDPQSFPQEQIDSRCIRSDESGRKRGYILKNNGGMTVRGVEQVALEHYAENGYPEGEHCEGSPIRALLMLFFWDIIYNPKKHIPGIFICKLQTEPLDMWTPYFYQNRKQLIDQRLEEIDSKWPEEKLVTFAATHWRQHAHERAAFGIIMDVIKDESDVENLISVINRKVLAKIFERLIKNIRGCRSGMPDLLVWNSDQKICKFVEVKGEGDRLSTGQKLWLQHLQDSGAAIEVCHVHSTGSKRKKIKTKIYVNNIVQNNEAGPSCRPDD